MYVCMYVCDIAPTNGRMAGVRTTVVYVCMYVCMYVCDIDPTNGRMAGARTTGVLGSVCMYVRRYV